MESIIAHIFNLTRRDISAYAESFLNKAIAQRILETNTVNESGYLKLLEDSLEETELMLNSLNISFSLFFRNPLDYSIIERFVLPSLFHRKIKSESSSVRIWSAGCADGSEAYTLAIIGEELYRNSLIHNPLLIFATDLSEKALLKARVAVYQQTSLQNVRMYIKDAYFTESEQLFRLNDHLKKNIEFSWYDLLDTKTSSPPGAIFGGFDMVICANLMVYYNRETQQIILEKLYHSLGEKGFLMVDPSEKAIVKSFRGFKLYSSLGNIFVKN